MTKTLRLNFANFSDCWEGVNDFLINNEHEIKQGFGGVYGTELCCYNNLIQVENATLDPNWDFGKILGYTSKKWSKLVLNYLDMNYLDVVKSEIQIREQKKAKSYNHVVHFDNSHGSGKDCLISLNFQRRADNPNPIVIYHTRASEVTKRLPFDLLLIQRMAEYVYGPNTPVQCIMFIPFMYIHVENSLLYIHHKGGVGKAIHEYDTNHAGLGTFQKRVIRRYNEFKTKPLDTITYQVHWKAAAVIQDKRNVPSLLAKDLSLNLYGDSRINKTLQAKLNKGILI